MDDHRGSYIQLATAENGTYNTTGFKELKYPRIKDPSLVRGRVVLTKRDGILITIVCVIVVVVIAVTLAIGLPKLKEKRAKYFDTGIVQSPSILRNFNKAALVSDGKPCADIGRDILAKGGSAVDAGIAMVFCGGVVNPHSMGLGGGFIMTVYIRANKSVDVIDAREEAPGAATEDMFHGNGTMSKTSGLSIAVPGELRGLKLAYQKYGKLNWSELVEPSTNLCRNGFAVSEHLANGIAKYKKQILAEDSMKDLFFNNDTNELYKEGEIAKCLSLANTLEIIGKEGYDALYNGTLAKQFVQDIQSFGGIITEEDMSKYQAKSKKSVSVTLRDGKTIHSAPPPASGPILTMIMNILDGYNFTKDNFGDLDKKVLTYHRMVESFKFAFAQRTSLGDEDFVNTSRIMLHSTSKKYAEHVRTKISDEKTFEPDYYGPQIYATEDHGTAHASVFAENGDAVSVTSTINTYFGCLKRSISTGIILNNEMDDFSSPNITNYFGIPPSPANFIQPGKRPLSSMCPAFIINSNGDIDLILGGAGGTRILTATAMVASSVLWMDMDIKEAIDAPRLHHQLYPDLIQNEKNFPQVILDRLSTLGHQHYVDHEGSVVLAIRRQDSGVSVNVDHRKGGSSTGL